MITINFIIDHIVFKKNTPWRETVSLVGKTASNKMKTFNFYFVIIHFFGPKEDRECLSPSVPILSYMKEDNICLTQTLIQKDPPFPPGKPV